MLAKKSCAKHSRGAALSRPARQWDYVHNIASGARSRFHHNDQRVGFGGRRRAACLEPCFLQRRCPQGPFASHSMRARWKFGACVTLGDGLRRWARSAVRGTPWRLIASSAGFTRLKTSLRLRPISRQSEHHAWPTWPNRNGMPGRSALSRKTPPISASRRGRKSAFTAEMPPLLTTMSALSLPACSKAARNCAGSSRRRSCRNRSAL